MKPTLEHISASGIKSYLTDGYAWYLKYIKKVSSSQVGPALLVGNACHRFAEHAWKQIQSNGFNSTFTEVDQQFKQLYRDELESRLASPNVDFGKTGTPEKYLSYYDKAVNGYHDEVVARRNTLFITTHPDNQDVYDVELGFLHPYINDKTGELGALNLKGFIDLVTYTVREGVGYFTIRDHKFVSQYKREAEDPLYLDPGYWIQAGVYYYGLKEHLKTVKDELLKLGIHDVYIHGAYFDEFKITPNRDKSPQLKPHFIPFNKMTLAVFDDLYNWVSNDMLGNYRHCSLSGVRISPPNPFQMGDYGKEAWREYVIQVKY